jgi:sec-independent protein translocase protein TatC
MSKIPITAHLIELRKRLVHAAFAILIGFGIAYSKSDMLLRWFTQPLVNALPVGQRKLIFTGLAEAFMVHIHVSLVAGIIIVLPYLFYQIWLFIGPGLYKTEQQAALPIIASACGLFATGFGFAYYIVFPIGCRFFASYNTDYLMLLPSLKEYLAFAWRFLLMFGIVFELPLVSYILSKIGIITGKMLSQYRRYAIVAIFIIAAVFTPPDVFSQMMMALPLLVLYEISIWVAHIFGKKKAPEADAQ